jgi:hypothetical protein
MAKKKKEKVEPEPPKASDQKTAFDRVLLARPAEPVSTLKSCC